MAHLRLSPPSLTELLRLRCENLDQRFPFNYGIIFKYGACSRFAAYYLICGFLYYRYYFYEGNFFGVIAYPNDFNMRIDEPITCAEDTLI